MRGVGARDRASTSPRASSAPARRPSSGSGASNARATCSPRTAGKARSSSSPASRSAARSVTRAARERNSAFGRCRAFMRRTPWHTRRAAADCRLDGVAQSAAGGVARADAAALDRASDGGGRRRHHRGGDRGRRTLIYEPRPAARPAHAAYRPVARLTMTALAVSNVVLWILVLLLSVVVLALVRQLGVLHERIAPAGALMLNRGPPVGEPAPVLEVADLEGHAHRVGAARADGRSTLLLFVSPTCPVCESLLPAVKSSRKDERAWMDVILASDGDTLEQRQFVRSQGLDGIPYVVSAALGLAYQVGRLPFAALLDEHGILRARGLVNSREHLESLFEAKRLGVASLQEYFSGAL